MYIFIYLSSYLSIFLFFIYLLIFIYLSIYLSNYLTIYISILSYLSRTHARTSDVRTYAYVHKYIRVHVCVGIVLCDAAFHLQLVLVFGIYFYTGCFACFLCNPSLGCVFFMEANCGRLLPPVEGAGANQPDHHPTPRIGGQEPGDTFIRRKICGWRSCPHVIYCKPAMNKLQFGVVFWHILVWLEELVPCDT